ncbi:MAG: hypothetical protein ABL921_29400, partial [Pirellula sp.]
LRDAGIRYQRKFAALIPFLLTASSKHKSIEKRGVVAIVSASEVRTYVAAYLRDAGLDKSTASEFGLRHLSASQMRTYGSISQGVNSRLREKTWQDGSRK